MDLVPCSVFSVLSLITEALLSNQSDPVLFVCSSAGQHGTRCTIAYSKAERLVQTKMFEG